MCRLYKAYKTYKLIKSSNILPINDITWNIANNGKEVMKMDKKSLIYTYVDAYVNEKLLKKYDTLAEIEDDDVLDLFKCLRRYIIASIAKDLINNKKYIKAFRLIYNSAYVTNLIKDPLYHNVVMEQISFIAINLKYINGDIDVIKPWVISIFHL